MASTSPPDALSTGALELSDDSDQIWSRTPLELIRRTFELATESDVGTGLTLLLVTKWAHRRLLPVFYERIILKTALQSHEFRQMLQNSKQGAEIPKYIKRLSLTMTERHPIDLLYKFQSLTSLVASSSLFKKPDCDCSYCQELPVRVLTPELLSPHVTHVTISGPANQITPNKIPSSVTHLVLKDNTQMDDILVDALLRLPKLTHLAFHHNVVGYTPHLKILLDRLLSKGRMPNTEQEQRQSATDKPAVAPLSLVVARLPIGTNSRAMTELEKYDSPYLLINPRSTEMEDLTEVRCLRLHKDEWWTQEEWTLKGGEDTFWKRMAKIPGTRSSNAG